MVGIVRAMRQVSLEKSCEGRLQVASIPGSESVLLAGTCSRIRSVLLGMTDVGVKERHLCAKFEYAMVDS